jgi:hypothetical protein
LPSYVAVLMYMASHPAQPAGGGPQTTAKAAAPAAGPA